MGKTRPGLADERALWPLAGGGTNRYWTQESFLSDLPLGSGLAVIFDWPDAAVTAASVEIGAEALARAAAQARRLFSP